MEPKHNKIILTGFCRSGTTSTAQFFQLFGIPSHHQKMGPGKNKMVSHDFRNPPDEFKQYYDKKGRTIRESWGFEASWEFSHYIYGLSKRASNATWIISLREPFYACNSLKNYNRKNTAIDRLAALYLDTYTDIFLQIRQMDKKPYWMDFSRYIEGQYIGTFFEFFSIPHSVENSEAAHKHLTKKVRSSGGYHCQYSKLFPSCREAIDAIKRICKEVP